MHIRCWPRSDIPGLPQRGGAQKMHRKALCHVPRTMPGRRPCTVGILDLEISTDAAT
jgi:hypothetical protein